MLTKQHDYQQIDYIRELFLRQLAGDKLKDYEECELQAAQLLPELKKMCKELNYLYSSPEMMELLKERPTSTRLQELVDNIYDIRGPKFSLFNKLRGLKSSPKQHSVTG